MGKSEERGIKMKDKKIHKWTCYWCFNHPIFIDKFSFDKHLKDKHGK
jgi:hypothetical protein